MQRTRKATFRLALVLAVAAAALTAVSTASAWTVEMTAVPKLKRTHSWKIEKSVSRPTVTLQAGETADVTYTVTVTHTGSVDSDWSVSGQATMSDDPVINIASVEIFVLPEDFVTTVTCVPVPPSTLESGMVCDYFSPLPDASPGREVQLRAEQVNGNRRGLRVPFDFSNAVVDEIDECVAVTDTMAGALGTVCAAGSPRTFTYTKTVGGYAQCGSYTVPNTASFLTGDTGATGAASASVDVTVTCAPEPGCTRTIGYWKTHAGFGPQADVVTPLLSISLGTGGGARTVAVTTAAKAVSLLQFEGSNGAKAASNGINKLYAQLLGAKLSGANGADTTAIAATIAAADAYLATHDSLSWKGASKAEQASVLAWMTALDDYNNGRVGPQHCD